jgi:hypothetical protein
MTDRDRLIELLKKADENASKKLIMDYDDAIADNADYLLANGVIVPVHCKDCVHCKQLAPHCEINRYDYFHCELWRGEETKNVWHKYKKYYADYSIVCADDYCSYGELKEREGK